MAFFTWDEKYRIGMTDIDQQHQHLFELISHFYETVIQKDVKRAMTEILNGLMEYANSHFKLEEEYMQKYRYPQYARHAAQHAQFAEKVTDIRTRYQAGELVIPIEIANFLKDWLSKHVLGEDQKYGPFLRDKGV